MAKKSTAIGAPYEDNDWMCSQDADTLVRASEIVADKKRLKAAQDHIAKKQQGLDQLMNGLRRRT